MFVDSHTHIFDEKIDFDSIDLSKIDAMLVPAYSIENLDLCLDFCKTHPKCFCALGVHPMYATDFNENILVDLISKNRDSVFAVGEIGLDSGCGVERNLQERALVRQLEIAREFNLPVTLHLRTADDFADFFRIYAKFPDVKCAIHCFNGTENDLQKCIDLGCFVSFAGNITYKGRKNLRELAKKVPEERLLIETDAPSMLPGIFARIGVNTPNNLVYVADTLAKERGVTVEEIAYLTRKNANSLFKLGLENE